MILQAFSSLKDSMIPWVCESCAFAMVDFVEETEEPGQKEYKEYSLSFQWVSCFCCFTAHIPILPIFGFQKYLIAACIQPFFLQQVFLLFLWNRKEDWSRTQLTAGGRLQHSWNIFLSFKFLVLGYEEVSWLLTKPAKRRGFSYQPWALELLWLTVSSVLPPRDLIQSFWIREGLKIAYPTAQKVM